MTVNIFGLPIYEFDVVITDLLLVVELFIFAFLILRQRSTHTAFRRILVVFFILFGVSSLLGAVFHAFFPLKEATKVGEIFWIITASSIIVSATTVWLVNTFLSGGKNRLKIAVPPILIYLAIGLYYIVYINYQFSAVIIFYSLPVIGMLAISVTQFLRGYFKKVRECRCAWVWLMAGILLIFAAAAIQYFQVGLHPAYFNYNAFYHLVQGVSFAFMFLSFRSFLKSNGDGRVFKF